MLHGTTAQPRTSVIGFPSSDSHVPAVAPDLRTGSGALSFSGQGHEIWQNRPTTGRSVTAAPMSASERTLFGPSASGTVRHPVPPHRVFYPPLATPVVFAPAFGYYPFGYVGSGFCDPFWGFDPGFGCGGFGYGFGAGYGLGYGYGGYFGSGFGYDNSFGVGATSGPMDFENDTPSNDYGTYSTAPSLEQGTDQSSPAETTAPAPPSLTALYLKDGTNFDVMSYWLDAGKLHYITNYGGESTVDMGQIDLQRTVDENARLGVDFTLRPNPPAPPAQSQPAPDSQPTPQQ